MLFATMKTALTTGFTALNKGFSAVNSVASATESLANTAAYSAKEYEISVLSESSEATIQAMVDEGVNVPDAIRKAKGVESKAEQLKRLADEAKAQKKLEKAEKKKDK